MTVSWHPAAVHQPHTPPSLLPMAAMPPALLATWPCHQLRLSSHHGNKVQHQSMAWGAALREAGAAAGTGTWRTGRPSSYRLEASAVGSTVGFLGHLAPHLGEMGPQHILPCKPHAKGHPKLTGSAAAHQAGTQGATGSSYQGIRRPKRVHDVLLMKKPTMGSVMASQTRPTNRMMEAEKGSSCRKILCQDMQTPMPLAALPELLGTFPTTLQPLCHPGVGDRSPGLCPWFSGIGGTMTQSLPALPHHALPTPKSCRLRADLPKTHPTAGTKVPHGRFSLPLSHPPRMLRVRGPEPASRGTDTAKFHAWGPARWEPPACGPTATQDRDSP